jgi:tetratricopeptide (TPR) repeat protein
MRGGILRRHSARGGRSLLAALGIAACGGLLAAGCAGPREDAAAYAHAAYRANRLAEADSAFEAALRASPGDATLRAWRAETLRRLQRYEEAEREARVALSGAGAAGFAHTVLAACYDPVNTGWDRRDRDSCLTHLEAAVRVDPSEPEAWLSIWKYAVVTGDTAREREALRRVEAARYFTPAALEYGRWQLAELPERAVLITNGDMDTYPAVILQKVRGVRADVTVLNASLLHLGEYATTQARAAGLPVPPDVAAAIASGRFHVGPPGKEALFAHALLRSWRERAMSGTLGRPLAFAVTCMDVDDLDDPALRLCGSFRLVAPGDSAAAEAKERFRRAVFGIEPESFSGPWVSDADRSPIRRTTVGGLGENLIAATLMWGQAALDAGDREGARMAAERIEAIAKRLASAPDVSEHVRLLRSESR